MNKTLKRQVDLIFRDITAIGGFIFFVLLSISVFVLGMLDVFFQLILGFIITMGVVVLIRTFYFKNRPKKVKHSNFIERIEASSFPSLHTARTVFVACVFINFFNNSLVTLFLAIIAALVAYSRIYLKKHDWIDVLVGVGLGLVTFWLISFF